MHHTRATKTNSAVNLSRKPGLDLCCDLLQHLQGVPRTCSFYIIIRTSILLVPSLKLSFIPWYEIQPYPSLELYGWHVLLNFVVFYSTCNNIMHIIPLPPCALYSICTQNGYGQHRPCKIVLLTLAAPRGVTDLYVSITRNTQKTRERSTMKLVELSINNHTVDVIHKHHMEHSTSAPNERVLRTTQLAKLSFNHPSVVLTADVFRYFYKKEYDTYCSCTCSHKTLGKLRAARFPCQWYAELCQRGVGIAEEKEEKNEKTNETMDTRQEHTTATKRSTHPLVPVQQNAVQQ